MTEGDASWFVMLLTPGLRVSWRRPVPSAWMSAICRFASTKTSASIFVPQAWATPVAGPLSAAPESPSRAGPIRSVSSVSRVPPTASASQVGAPHLFVRLQLRRRSGERDLPGS